MMISRSGMCGLLIRGFKRGEDLVHLGHLGQARWRAARQARPHRLVDQVGFGHALGLRLAQGAQLFAQAGRRCWRIRCSSSPCTSSCWVRRSTFSCRSRLRIRAPSAARRRSCSWAFSAFSSQAARAARHQPRRRRPGAAALACGQPVHALADPLQRGGDPLSSSAMSCIRLPPRAARPRTVRLRGTILGSESAAASLSRRS